MGEVHKDREPHKDSELLASKSLKDFFGEHYETIVKFFEKLASEGELRGLIGPREKNLIFDRHILNSAALSAVIEKDASLVDVGSGAGFPGLVLAIMRPDLKISLVESKNRRVDWLEECVNELGLKNVKVINARAEELYGKLRADFVTARALAPLKKLLPLLKPFVKSGGAVVALKGKSVNDEVYSASKEIKAAKVKTTEVLEGRTTTEASPATILKIVF
jgi:16S rRNA (guanine527-N7)-methyltransferase